MKRLKDVRLKTGRFLHVETPLGIVNIRTGLHDADGCPVDSIEIIADPGCVRRGSGITQVIQVGPKCPDNPEYRGLPGAPGAYGD